MLLSGMMSSASTFDLYDELIKAYKRKKTVRPLPRRSRQKWLSAARRGCRLVAKVVYLFAVQYRVQS